MTKLEKIALQEALKLIHDMQFHSPTSEAGEALQKAIETVSPSLPTAQQKSLVDAVKSGKNTEVLKLYTLKNQAIGWIEAVLNEK